LKNPFKPTAGANPPFVIGRENHLNSFKESLENGPGAPGLLSLIMGSRGIGKTVLLNEAEEYAASQGWVVISETATDDNLLNEVERVIRKNLEAVKKGPPLKIRLNHIQGGPVALGWDNPDSPDESLKELAIELATFLQAQGVGLFLAIDEIQAIEQKQLAKISSIVQHLIRKGLPIALMMAGVPAGIDLLLKEKSSTFLRRADMVELHAVPIDEVEASFKRTFKNTGIFITAEQVSKAAKATEGYPFLIQLIGYHLWQLVSKNKVVSDSVLDKAIATAKTRLNSLVLRTAFNDIHGVAREILLKMAEDNGPTKTADLAKALKKTPKYIGVYRHRLITEGIIAEAGWGQVTFAMPYMREYLREYVNSTYVSTILIEDD